MASDRILVVDDDPNMLLLLEFNLRQKGLSVETLADSDRAVERALDDDFALIVLDVMMPGTTGLEICERLRNEERTRDLPILLLTARTRVRDQREGQRVGATEYITKPFDPVAFAEKVAAYLDPRARDLP